MCELATAFRRELLLGSGISPTTFAAQRGLGRTVVTAPLEFDVPPGASRTATVSAALSAFLSLESVPEEESKQLEFTLCVVNAVAPDTVLTPSARSTAIVRVGGSPVTLTTALTLVPGNYTAYVTASALEQGFEAYVSSELTALTVVVDA
jgi:hypothetical protein